jgi:hypothetical protein
MNRILIKMTVALTTIGMSLSASAKTTGTPPGLDLIEKVFCPFYRYAQGPLLVMVIAGAILATVINYKLGGGNKVWGTILQYIVLVGVVASLPLAFMQAKGVNLANCIS